MTSSRKCVHELAGAMGTTVTYDLVMQKPNGPFTYKLTMNNLVGFGTSSSKDKAKSEAAKDAYHRYLGILNNAIENNDTEQNIFEKLKKFCLVNNFASPSFDEISQHGPDYETTFLVRCVVGNIKELCSSKSREEAKQLSALQMLDRLEVYMGCAEAPCLNRIFSRLGIPLEQDEIFMMKTE